MVKNVTLALVALALSGCGVVEHVAEHAVEGAQHMGPGVKGSGVVKTETRDVGAFDHIEAGSAVILTVKQGAPSLKVSVDDNLLPLLETKVEGGVLKIRFTEAISTSKEIKVDVTTQDLRGVDISGASRAFVDVVNKDMFSVEGSGASDVRLTGSTADLTVRLSGASVFEYSGVAGKSSVEASGASKAKVREVSGNLEVDASGASSVTVRCDGEIRASANGASHVALEGKGKVVSRKQSGASEISSSE